MSAPVVDRLPAHAERPRGHRAAAVMVDQVRMGHVPVHGTGSWAASQDADTAARQTILGVNRRVIDDSYSLPKPKRGTIAARIVVAMTSNGVRTTQELSALTGINRQTIHRWLTESADKIDPKLLFQVADVVNTSARWIATGKGPMQRPRILTADDIDVGSMFVYHSLNVTRRPLDECEPREGAASSQTQLGERRSIRPLGERPSRRHRRTAMESCECCGRELKPGRSVWLELDQRDNTYHDFRDVPEEFSQGWFVFGNSCANRKRREARKARSEAE